MVGGTNFRTRQFNLATQLVGPKSIVRTARSLGIRIELPAYFSIGLGAVPVSPHDVARADATIANAGKRIDGALIGDRPRVIEKVEDARTGRVQENRPVAHPVLTEGEAGILTWILEDVVTLGTGKRAALPGRAVAGKTGTTDHYGDAWFVGYTPQLVVAVWVGYPNQLKPMLSEFGGDPVAGGTLPALVWKGFMTRALAKLGAKPKAFPAP